MSYILTKDDFNKVLAQLKSDYKIYAPKRFKNQGRYSDTDLIRYDEINIFEDIVYKEKSDFSPKEIIYPITQALFYFTEDEYRESKIDNKKIIIFCRACDINGIRRLDTIFLSNGGREDVYYKRLRDKVKFVLMECNSGWDTCFCVSMGSNKTSNYSLAVRFEDNNVLIEVKDDELAFLFSGFKHIDFLPQFVTSNPKKVNIPIIDDEKILEKVINLDMWKDYESRCISCGACNAACITCSCFNTQDIAYTENGRVGERRRIQASCMHKDFATVAGGYNFRENTADRMRFKTLHKIYDYKARFKLENMCVGCGRCDERCPELISFSSTINKLYDEVGKLKAKDILENEVIK